MFNSKKIYKLEEQINSLKITVKMLQNENKFNEYDLKEKEVDFHYIIENFTGFQHMESISLYRRVSGYDKNGNFIMNSTAAKYVSENELHLVPKKPKKAKK